jgi:hypothetical protein
MKRVRDYARQAGTAALVPLSALTGGYGYIWAFARDDLLRHWAAEFGTP